MFDQNSIDEIDPTPRLPDGTPRIFCSFCGLDQTQVEVMVCGATANICDHCVEVCRNVVNANRTKEPSCN